ncbi:MAG: ABC transporter permease [Chloroflexi bacterium]|nr:ABC transporter permease [Chloroflexota bacterium]
MATTTAMPGRFAASAAPASSFWDLLLAVTLRDLRVKYHGTFLSYFWWIARPLTLGLVMYFALGRVLKIDIENHAAFLLSALFPWFWFQNGLHSATNCFVANSGLVKKVQFPRIILPLSVVLGSTFEFVITLPVLVLLLFITGINPDWTWLAGVLPLLALELALLCGLGVLVASLNVYFRDIGPGLDSVLLLLFYLTPIFYPLERVPDGYRQVLLLNPLTPLIEEWREMFLFGDMPGLDLWPTVVFSVVAVAAGWFALRIIGKNMADAL